MKNTTNHHLKNTARSKGRSQVFSGPHRVIIISRCLLAGKIDLNKTLQTLLLASECGKLPQHCAGSESDLMHIMSYHFMAFHGSPRTKKENRPFTIRETLRAFSSFSAMATWLQLSARKMVSTSQPRVMPINPAIETEMHRWRPQQLLKVQLPSIELGACFNR